MPKRKELKKVVVIGSGPIIIGQAAEFDYSGSQALTTLREEGVYTVLVNSNPATIMTDKEMADKVYLEPLTTDFLKQIIIKEKPDGVLPSLGGQTGLNLALALAEEGFLDQEGVDLLGVNLQTIKKAEDREMFKQLMLELGEPIPESQTVSTLEEAIEFKKKISLPLIIRPAFTLGGTGGGIARTEEEFEKVVKSGLNSSPINQCLIERSIAGFKEIEYEILRDKNDNCIVVCNMENFDPVGVHTGDSIVVAPSQTLSDKEHQILRDASLKIIRALKIEGGCNVQLAMDPLSFNYYVIEVNPRVSRSSALASKATGYPIAQISAKIALGYTLDEITNPITQNTNACFEPAIDYIVCKIPRWPFDKFYGADRRLGTQMKATGEVMAIGRSFEESLLKGIRGLEIKRDHLYEAGIEKAKTDDLLESIANPTDERIFELAELIRRDISIHELHNITKIDLWFLNKILNIINLEKRAKKEDVSKDLLKELKRRGFGDSYLARLKGLSEVELREKRKSFGITSGFKMVDTCAGEFESATPYFYSCFEEGNESKAFEDKSVLVLGSGPIRIGQGVEFDYATVHAVKALKALGYKAIVINNNPETVSTDFNTSDKLYFDAVTFEDVMNIIDLESPVGVICQFGGQTAINLTPALDAVGVNVLGTSFDNIDKAEDRNRFEEMLKEIDIARPLGTTFNTEAEAVTKAKELGYPLMLRPSYVIGGEAMEVVDNEQELIEYAKNAANIWPDRPVLMDKYLIGLEIEVDAICDGTDICIPGIMEHIERSGVHSGDSFAVYPPQTILDEMKDKILQTTQKISNALDIRGLVNIQFIIKSNQLYVLEVNPRSSRTIPFLSKVTDIQMAQIATQVVMGKTLKELNVPTGILPESEFTSIKAPVFSFSKLSNVDTALGPEMKSTGEAMGRDITMQKALYKAFTAAGIKIPFYGSILATIADKHKEETLPILRRYYDAGFKVIATKGTAEYLAKNDIETDIISKIGESENDILWAIKKGKVDLVLNTISKGKSSKTDGFKMRRVAAETGVICLTSIDTCRALIETIELNSLSTMHL